MTSGYNPHFSCTPKWSEVFETNAAGQRSFSERLFLGAIFTNGTNAFAGKGLNVNAPFILTSVGLGIPAASPSRGGDVTVYVFQVNQPSLPSPFYSVLVFVFVLMALSAIFQSMNSPPNSPLSHSVLSVLFLPD